MNIETISERILFRLEQLPMSKADVGRALHLKNPQNFSNWIARNSVPKDYLHPLSVVFGVNLLWLQFGKGPMLLDERTASYREDSAEEFLRKTDERMAVGATNEDGIPLYSTKYTQLDREVMERFHALQNKEELLSYLSFLEAKESQSQPK